MIKFTLHPEHFILAASPILKLRMASLDGTTEHRCWMSCFRAEPPIMTELWTRIDPKNNALWCQSQEYHMGTLFFKILQRGGIKRTKC